MLREKETMESQLMAQLREGYIRVLNMKRNELVIMEIQTNGKIDNTSIKLIN